MDLAALTALGLGGLGLGAYGLQGTVGMQQMQQMGQQMGGTGAPSGAELPANAPLTGIVKAWMDDKGFGFVTPSIGGPDVFVHKNQLTDGERLAQGSTVTFECRYNPSRRKYEATVCHGAQAAGAVPPIQHVAPPTIGNTGVPVPPPAPVRGGYPGGGDPAALARDKDNLFVAGLPMDYTEDRVKELFSQYGTVTQCKLLPDQPGKNDKAALVRFQDENQAKWMVQNMHGNIPVGMTTPLIVRYAGERGGKGAGSAGYGKGAAPMQDHRYSPYGAAEVLAAMAGDQWGAQYGASHGATASLQGLQGLGALAGAGLDPNLAAALMQLVAPQGQAAAGHLDATTLALLAASQGFGGATASATAAAPAFDASALAAAASAAAAQSAPAQLQLTHGGQQSSMQAAGAVAPPPPAAGGQWSEATDPSTGKTYYYHTVTRETRWEKPV